MRGDCHEGGRPARAPFHPLRALIPLLPLRCSKADGSFSKPDEEPKNVATGDGTELDRTFAALGDRELDPGFLDDRFDLLLALTFSRETS